MTDDATAPVQTQPANHAPVFEDSYKKIPSELEIDFLLKARYPLIYVTSSEEERVERVIIRLANQRQRKVAFWSSTQGFSQQGGSDIRDPLAALNHMIESKESAIYVLRDFHDYIHVPDIKRRLRDLAREFRTSYKNCILLSALQKIPPEIEKEFAVVDFDMPGIPDILNAMTNVLKAVGPESKAYAWKSEFEKDEPAQLKIAEAALGLTLVEIQNVLAKSLVQARRYDIDIIHSEKEQIIRKSGTLEFLHADASFGGVGGLDLMKAWLRKRAKAFSKEARTFGLPEPRGILMLGIPGCGKSLMAKAVSSLWKLPLIRLDVGKVMGSLVGASEEGMRKAIKTAESVAPCILWLDELEKGLAGTQSSGASDGGTTARVFGTFITWLQEKRSPVFVIGTANNVKQLPPELLRKGRFDEIFFVDLPAARERQEIIEIHIKLRGRNPEQFDVKAIVDATEGFSGSELEQMVISALYDAFDRDDEINDEYLLHACEETVPLSRTMQEDIAGMRDWAKSRARLASSEVRLEERDAIRKIEI
jgi:SpoVK/Ycf46/Vps4 family AAA+-type ATPase